MILLFMFSRSSYMILFVMLSRSSYMILLFMLSRSSYIILFVMLSRSSYMILLFMLSRGLIWYYCSCSVEVAIWYYCSCSLEVVIKRLLHDIFHIGPGISPRLPYQARQRRWRADMGRGLIKGTIWKISCHYLFIKYFTWTFSKLWLLNCKKDLWTDKLRK